MRALCSDHDTGLHEGLMDLSDSIDEAGISVGKVSIDSDGPVLTDGGGHDLLKTRVDDVDLIGTLDLVSLGLKTHKLEELDLRLLLVLLGQSSWGDVIKVLQPFEVGAGDTTTVDEHVWGGNNSSANKDLLGSVSCGSVGTFEDGIDLDVFGVTGVEGLLSGSGDHAVGVLEKEGLRVLTNSLGGIRVGGEGSMLNHEVLDLLNVKTIGVVDGGVVLDDGSDLATILLDELGGPVADGTETLNDEGLILDTKAKIDARSEGLGVEEFTDSVVDTETSRLGTTSDTALGNELSSAASLGVDVCLATNVHVGVLDPGHDLLVGAHVWSKAIDLSSDEVLLDKLHGVLSGCTLNFSLRVFSWVNFHASLCASERNVRNGELEGHEGSKSLNLLEIDT